MDLRQHDPLHGRGRADPAPAQLRSQRHRGPLLLGDRAEERGAALGRDRGWGDPRRCHPGRAAAGSPSSAASSASRSSSATTPSTTRIGRRPSSARSPFADLREGKVTLPLLLALKRSHERRARGRSRSLLKSARATRLGEASLGHRAHCRCSDLAPGLEDLVDQRYRGVEDTNAPRRRARGPRGHDAIAAVPRRIKPSAICSSARSSPSHARSLAFAPSTPRRASHRVSRSHGSVQCETGAGAALARARHPASCHWRFLAGGRERPVALAAW